MTLRQRLMVFRGVLATTFLAFIGLVVSIAIGPNLLEAFQEDWILGIVATLFFLMCLLMGIGCAIGAFAEMVDVTVGRARSATGPIKIHTDKLTTNALARPLPSSYSYPGQYTYHLEVRDHEFTISRELFEALAHHVGELTVYYSAQSGELLTFEEPKTA
jgi:hypothetical protein